MPHAFHALHLVKARYESRKINSFLIHTSNEENYISILLLQQQQQSAYFDLRCQRQRRLLYETNLIQSAFVKVLLQSNCFVLTLCIRITPKRVHRNSVDLDEMQHNAAFRQGLHCL